MIRKTIKGGDFKSQMIGELVFDQVPEKGSFNPVTSDAVAKIAGAVEDLDAIVPEDASEENKLATAADVAGVQEDVDAIEGKIPSDTSTTNKLVNESGLQDAIDNASESWSTGFTPKGESSVSDLNDLATQSNGDSYIVTDSGTLTDGSLAVVAGEQVAWDATNSVWYKLPQYALRSAVDNISDSIAEEFVPNSTTTVAGLLYMYKDSLYVSKVGGYQGPWDASKFEQSDISQLLFKESDSTQFVNFSMSITGDVVYDSGTDSVIGKPFVKAFDSDFYVVVPNAYVTGIAQRFAILEISHWESDGSIVSDVVLRKEDMAANLGRVIKSNNKGYGVRLFIRHQDGEPLDVDIKYLQFLDISTPSAFSRNHAGPGDVVRFKDTARLLEPGQYYPADIESAPVVPNGLEYFIENGRQTTISLEGKLVESGGTLSGDVSVKNISGDIAVKVPEYWITKNIQSNFTILSVGHYNSDGTRSFDFELKANDNDTHYNRFGNYVGCWISARDKGFGTFIYLRAEEGTTVTLDAFVTTKYLEIAEVFDNTKVYGFGSVVNVDGSLSKCSVPGLGLASKFVKSSDMLSLLTGEAINYSYTGNYKYNSDAGLYNDGTGATKIFCGDIVVNIPEQWWTDGEFPNNWAMIEIGRYNADGTSSSLYKATRSLKECLGKTVKVSDAGYGTYIYLRARDGVTVTVPIIVRESEVCRFTRIRYGHWNIGHFAMGTSPDPTITPEQKSEKIAAFRSLFNGLALDVLGICEDDERFCISDGTSSLDAIYGCFGGYQRSTRDGYMMESLYYNGIKVLRKSTSPLLGNRAIDVIAVIDGKVVHFVEVHLDWTSLANRTAQIQTLVNNFKDADHVVISGDFNIGPNNSGPDEEDEMKIFLDNGFKMALMDYMPKESTYTTSSSCLDNIVCKGFDITGVKVVQDSGTLSDHYLVVADLIAK